jgi:NodT family efflux transporter outer membrane factor (OMF) lipoprotein
MSPSNDLRLPSPAPLAAPLAALLLAACAAGPDYVRPALPAPASYEAAPLQASAGGARLLVGQDVPPQWWSMFGAPRLDAVMQQALQGNLDLDAARRSLARAQALSHAATAGLYPEVDGNAGIGREKLGAASLGNADFPAFSYYSVGASVSYTLDLAGGLHRAIEEQGARVDAQRYQQDAAVLSLTGNVAMAALRIAAARAQIDSLQALLAQDERNAGFVRQAFEAGAVSRVDLLSAQSQLANDQALLPPLQQQLAVARHQLSLLAGRAPAQWSPPDFGLQEFSLPAELPLELPSELAHRRPDILATEAELHAATAALGVATADLYPQLTLTGGLSLQATEPNRLFEASSLVGSLMAGLTGPIFDHGARSDRREAAREAAQGALDRYEQALLASFGQVADVLAAIENDARLELAQQRAADAAQANLELARLSYQAGNSGILQVLDAQRASAQAQLGLVRAHAQRLQDDVQLVLALGGSRPAAAAPAPAGDRAQGPAPDQPPAAPLAVASSSAK